MNFFQCDHDKSVRAVLHNYFDLPEPHYKYKWPAHYVPKQTKKLPHYDPEYITESFNLYLERYEDKKHLAERTFLELFKDYSPFKDQTNPPSQFIIPNSKKIFIPSWKVDEMIAKYSRSQRFIPDLEQETDIDDSSENL
ncbi:MAG: 39S ribosomal protein L38, mitochondrial [Marteilia pararefringens]